MPEAVLTNPLMEGLNDTRSAQPHTVVIFGATGDLTARKLIPALFELNRGGYIPARSAILGLGRRDKDDAEFRDDVSKALREYARTGPPTDPELEAFIGRVYYFKSSYMEEDAYPHLCERLQQLETKLAIPPNRLFYLATTPDAFPFIIEHLSRSGLVKPPAAAQGWQRVVI
ncbi:MAG: glucose-6-phosphate dehydrogenase, partial [bacterium]